MSSPERRVILVANWKMYKTMEEALRYVEELIPLVADIHDAVYLAVPYTCIHAVAKAVEGSKIVVGAQNMNDASEGAFTGEIAVRMLKEAGARFVILGHSERRRYFHESNDFINRKVKKALASSVEAILCIGETLEERDSGKTTEVLKAQLLDGTKDVELSELKHLVVAYEPIWAIGSHQPATAAIAEEVHTMLRQAIEEKWGLPAAQSISLLYGGSVKPDNAGAFLAEPNIDGLLIGGASLEAVTFSKIAHYQQTNS